MKKNQTSTHDVIPVYEGINSPEKPVLVKDFTDPIIELLKSKFDQRSLVGIEKYGTTLADNNEDDFLMHLLEEQMDSCAYLMKLIVDREKKKNEKQ